MVIPAQSSPRLIVWIATGAIALGPLSMTGYTPAMPAIAESLNAPLAAVQISLSLFLAGYAVGQLWLGPLSDRVGRRPVMLGGLLLYLVATIGCMFAQTLEQLIVTRFVEGLGVSAGSILARAIVRDLFDEREAAKEMAIVMIVLSASPALAPILGGLTMELADWRWIFGWLALCGVALLTAASFLLPETNRYLNPHATDLRRMADTFRAIGRHPRFLGFLAIGAAVMAGGFAWQTVGPKLLILQLGVSPLDYGFYGLFIVGGFIGGSLISRFFSGRLGLVRTILWSLPALFLAVIGAWLVTALKIDVPVIVLLPMAVWSFGNGILIASATAGALQPFPDRAGAASALYGFCQMAGGALVGAAVSPFVSAGLEPVAVMFTAMLFLGAIPFFSLIVMPERAASRSAE